MHIDGRFLNFSSTFVVYAIPPLRLTTFEIVQGFKWTDIWLGKENGSRNGRILEIGL